MKRLTLNQRNILRAKARKNGLGYFDFQHITTVEYLYLRIYFRRRVVPTWPSRDEYYMDIAKNAISEGIALSFSITMDRHFNPEDI